MFTNEFLKGDIAVSDGIFAGIGEYSGEHEIDASDYTIVPGFIDGHINAVTKSRQGLIDRIIDITEHRRSLQIRMRLPMYAAKPE